MGHSNLNPNYHRHNSNSINGVGNNNINMNNGNNVMGMNIGNGYNVNGMVYPNFKSGNSSHSRTASTSSVSMAYTPGYSKSSNSNYYSQNNYSPRPIKRYRIQPNEEMLIHKSRPLGYFGYSLQHKDQPEDVINEKTINSGYFNVPIIDIKSETMSARNDMIDKLKNPKYLSLLGSFAEEIIVEKNRQSHNKSTVSIIKSDNNESEEFMNSRVNIGNTKQIIRNIISQNISLFDSMRIIADLKHAWKNKPFTEWSQVIMEELIKFPNITSLQQQIQNSNNSNNSDSSQKNNSINEQQMIKKWNFCVKLTRYLFIEGLIEPRILLKGLLNIFDSSNFQQCVLFLPILKEYLNDFSRSRALMTSLLDTCIKKLSSIKEEYLSKRICEYHYINLISLVKEILIATPDVMIKPNTWQSLEKVLNNKYINYYPNYMNPLIKAAYENLFQTYRQMITKRNSLFNNYSFDTTLMDKDETEDNDEQLNYFENCTNFSELCKLLNLKMYYSNKKESNGKIIFNEPLSLEEKIISLCNWGIKFPTHGIYMTSILIKKLVEDSDDPDEELEKIQNIFNKYLNEFNIDDRFEYKKLVELFGELIRNELFFSDQYIRKLIARGYFEKNKRSEKNTKRYLRYLHDFPIFDADKEQINQRRILLYGVYKNPKELKEIKIFNKLKEMIKLKLPHIFDFDFSDEKNIKSYYDKPEDYEKLATFDRDEKTFMLLRKISSFWKCKISEWLKDVVFNYVVPDIPIGSDNWWYINPGDSLLNVRQFATIVEILEVIGDKNGIVDLCLWLIPKIKKRTMNHYIITCINKNKLLINLTKRSKELFDIIWKKHNKLKSENNIDRVLLLFLISFNETFGFEIEKDIMEQIEKDLKIEHKEFNNYEDVITTFEKTINSIKDYNAISPSDLLLLQCKYQHNVTELKKYFKYILEVKLERDYSKMNKNQIIYNFDIFTEILRQFNDGFNDFNDVLFGYLSENYLKDSLIDISNNNQQINYQNNSNLKQINFKLQNYFFILLFTTGSCSISRLLSDYFKPTMELFKNHLINGKSINENSIVLFDNVITLMHILFTVDDSKPIIDDLYLTTKMIHYLRSKRINILRSGESYNNCLDLFQTIITIFSELINKSHTALAKQFIPKIKVFLNDWIKAPWFFKINLININYLHKKLFNFNSLYSEDTSKNIIYLLTLYVLNMIYHGEYFVTGKAVESPILNINTIENNKEFKMDNIAWEEWNKFFKSVYLLYKDWTPSVCKVALILINNLWLLNDKNRNRSDEFSSSLIKGFIHATLSTLTETNENRNKITIETNCISQKAILSYISLFKPKFNVEIARSIIKSFYLNYETPLDVCINKKSELNLDSITYFADFFSAIVYNINIIKNKFDPNNNNNSNHMLGINEDMKYNIIKNLLNHFQWYNDNKKILDIMEDSQVLYDEAKYIVDNDLIETTSIFNKNKMLQSLTPIEENRKHLTIEIFRSNIFFMLKVLHPLLASICRRPKEGNILSWIKVLIHLLSSQIIHGNGIQIKLFEYTLDIVTFLLDETPDEYKKEQFLLTQEIQREIDIPPILASRINQILPIRIQNIYEFNLSISGNNNSKLISSNIINPWEWFKEIRPSQGDSTNENKKDENKNNGLVLKSVPLDSVNFQKDKIYPLSYFDINKYKKLDKGLITTYENHFDDFNILNDLDLAKSLNESINLEKLVVRNGIIKEENKSVANSYSIIDEKIIKPLNMQYNNMVSSMPKNNQFINNINNPLKRKSFQ